MYISVKTTVAAHSILQKEWQSRVYLHGQRKGKQQKNDRSSRNISRN